MSTGTKAIIPSQMKVQSALAQKSSWVRMIEDFEKSIFADDVLPNEDGSKYNNGKISTAEKVSHFVKGIGLTFTSMAKNWKGSLAGAIGFGTLLTFCPTLAVPLVVLGSTAGAFQIGSSIIKASTSTNNKDTRLAYQGLGSGLLTFLPSFFGSKAAVKTANKFGVIGDVTENDSLWKNYVECWKMSFGISRSKLNVYQAAKMTAASKFASLFKFSSKGGNGKAKSIFDKMKENLEKSKKTKKDTDLKAKEEELLGKNKDKLDAEKAYEANTKKKELIDKQIRKNKETLDNRIQSEEDYLNAKKEEIKALREEYDLVRQEISDRAYVDSIDQGQNNLPGDRALQNKKMNRIDQQKMQDIQAKIKKLQNETWEAYQNETAKLYEKTYIDTDDVTSLQSELSELETEAIDLEKKKNSAVDAFKKLETEIQDINNEIKSTEALIERVDELTQSEAFTKALAKLNDFDDVLVDTISHPKEWESFAKKKLVPSTGIPNKEIILSLDGVENDKHYSIFAQSIAGSGGRRLNPVIHDTYVRYAKLDDPDSIIKAYQELHPKVNFWSKETPFWDGITKTIQTFATGNWLKKQNE